MCNSLTQTKTKYEKSRYYFRSSLLKTLNSKASDHDALAARFFFYCRVGWIGEKNYEKKNTALWCFLRNSYGSFENKTRHIIYWDFNFKHWEGHVYILGRAKFYFFWKSANEWWGQNSCETISKWFVT